MRKLVPVLVVALSAIGAKASPSMCTSQVTKELEACAKANFEYSDEVLNRTYRDFAEKLSAVDKLVLRRAENEWIEYKKITCQRAYDATAPGEEAGIDKWTCLDQVTRARTGELRYLSTGIGALGFNKALVMVSKLYGGGEREKIVTRLADIFIEPTVHGAKAPKSSGPPPLPAAALAAAKHASVPIPQGQVPE